MKKQEFLDALRDKISGLPKEDIEERINFYSEMIDDRIEDGKKEAKAIKELGDLDEIASQIIEETPLSKIVKNKVKSATKPSALTIVLLILGSPVWLSLLISAFAVIFSLYVSIWAIVVYLWAVFGSFVVSAPVFSLAGIITVFLGYPIGGIVTSLSGILLAGLAILMYFGCLETTKGVIKLTKITILAIKRSLTKKKEARK